MTAEELPDVPMKFRLPVHHRVYFFVRRVRTWTRDMFKPMPKYPCPFCGLRELRRHERMGFFKCFRCMRQGEIKNLPANHST